jgi:hypothetical protein
VLQISSKAAEQSKSSFFLMVSVFLVIIKLVNKIGGITFLFMSKKKPLQTEGLLNFALY